MSVQYVSRKVSFIAVCLVLSIGISQSAFSQVEQQISLDEVQQQIIDLRNEFKLRIQKAEEDRSAIQQNVKVKLEDMLARQQSPDATTYTELKEELAQLETVLASYDQSITSLEETLETLESTMNAHLDTIEATLAEIEIQGLLRPPARQELHVIPEGTPTPTEGAPPMLEIPAGQLFRAAYKFYMEGDYDTAIAGFEKYLVDFPQTELAGAAQYWIAESFAKLEEYATAVEEYDRLIKKYPQNDKLADAYYGKGIALLRVGKSAEAKSLFLYVQDHFPGTIAAQKAGNRLKELP